MHANKFKKLNAAKDDSETGRENVEDETQYFRRSILFVYAGEKGSD